MNIILNEKQVKLILSNINKSEIEESGEPQTGTSETTNNNKTGYPEVGKWESGVTRGPGNQIAVTKWSDTVGSKVTRGKANPLK